MPGAPGSAPGSVGPGSFVYGQPPGPWSDMHPPARTHFVEVCLRAVSDVEVDGLRVDAGAVLPDDWCDEHVEEIVQLLEAGAIECVPAE